MTNVHTVCTLTFAMVFISGDILLSACHVVIVFVNSSPILHLRDNTAMQSTNMAVYKIQGYCR